MLKHLGRATAGYAHSGYFLFVLLKFMILNANDRLLSLSVCRSVCYIAPGRSVYPPACYSGSMTCHWLHQFQHSLVSYKVTFFYHFFYKYPFRSGVSFKENTAIAVHGLFCCTLCIHFFSKIQSKLNSNKKLSLFHNTHCHYDIILAALSTVA